MASVNRLGEPKSMEEFAKKSQFVTYNAWRNILEAWNSKMWNTPTGLILWMSHPAWPSFIWQTYTYDYETPGSYFGAKKACTPIHVQKNLPNNDVVIINTTLQSLKNTRVSATYYDLNGKILYKKEDKFDANANQLTPCFTPTPTHLPALYLVRLELKDNQGKTLSINDYWESTENSFREFNKLPKTKLRINSKRVGDKVQVEVSNTSSTMAIGIKLNAVDNKTNEILLPAYFSDGYFNLLGKEKRIIELDWNGKEPANYQIVAEFYNQ
jgi:hypothetical protein